MKNTHFNKRSKSFFEGWYFKHDNGCQTVSFIPSVNFDEFGRGFASIQIITDYSSHTIDYGFDEVYIDKKDLYIKIGNNIFTKDGASIDIRTGDFFCSGDIAYGEFSKIKYNIMGPLSILPKMECNHDVLSLYHKLSGVLHINGRNIDFNNGVGYIEKDWGCSFPFQYTWFQANKNGSSECVIAAIARIPYLGMKFKGHFAIVHIDGKEYRFATYNGSCIKNDDEKAIVFKKRGYTLKIFVYEGNAKPLKAPSNGYMTRIVHECVACPSSVEFYYKDKCLLKTDYERASYEIVKQN